MNMYLVGVFLAFAIALYKLYSKREWIFSKHKDHTLAIGLIFVVASSWLYVGGVLFKAIEKKARASE